MKKWSDKISICLLLSVLLSCEEYLDEYPTSNVTADFVYTTPAGLETGIVALYNIQRSFWENSWANGSIPLILDAKDDLTIARGGEIFNYGVMVQGKTPSDSYSYVDYWRLHYKIIDRANALIVAAEKVQGITEAKQKKVIAEAKFFRAHSIFILYKLFHNIYATTTPTSPKNALNIIQDKTSETEIYHIINDDLEYAIDNLEWTTSQTGRITQATARHIKAEVALWQQNWAEAKKQAEAIINTGYYGLVATTGLVFKGDLNHKEGLWVLQFKALVNGASYKINFNLMPNYADRIPGSKYSIEQGGVGQGWLTLNNYLRNLLSQDPNDTRVKGSYYIQDYVYNDVATLPVGKILGEKIVHDTWKEFAPLASDRFTFFNRLTAGCKKYFPDDGIPTESFQTKNIMLYRFAETLLFAAEANLRLGNIGNINDAVTAGTALGQLNAVRSRAGTKKLTWLTLTDILDEQAREFAFEGRRWYMLKRTGKLYDYIVNHAGYGRSGDLSAENSPGHANTPQDPFPFRTQARIIMKPYMVNWAIPQSEINLLGKNYPQNDGY